ncbi:cupredoxin domain-containing protein [bacterium]|nr:cupredoxin domain-containing protein [bacterium]
MVLPVVMGALVALLIVGAAVRASGRREQSALATADGGVQRVRIRVERGYDPEVITLRAGLPAVLEFQREEDDPCSERVILDGFGRNVFLPAFQTTAVEIQPNRTGSFDFACGMGMLKGRIVVQGADGEG